jgi:hypothetical protein
MAGPAGEAIFDERGFARPGAHAVWPPSTIMAWPMVNAAASEHSHSTADITPVLTELMTSVQLSELGVLVRPERPGGALCRPRRHRPTPVASHPEINRATLISAAQLTTELLSHRRQGAYDLV